MLDQILELFNIRPDYDLNLMRDDQSLSELSAAAFSGLDAVFTEAQPDWILVQGDTTTVAIASILAYYRRIKVGHVEAGLRTGNKWSPFPEEINRRIAGVVADLHFAPTNWARHNLLREGVESEAIFVTGNPAIDAVQYIAAQPEPEEARTLLAPLALGQRRLILVTAHRRESFGEPFRNICRAIRTIASRPDAEVIYPVHLNPNVQEPVQAILEGVPHVTLLPPLSYLTLVHLMKHAHLILTDSGGIQEEAAAMGVPALVMREVTERPEGIEAGALKLVGTTEARIVAETGRLLEDRDAHAAMARAGNPFGDGHAAQRIVDVLRKTVERSA
jgi:UDP-N-acetylglucosamine 2-epimerase (non-hydrolysing)